MELKVNNIYYGFKLLKKEEIKEINSLGLIFEHVKSGARLIKLLNKDDDKAFVIGFKTIPEDDCGTPHILEHSVLCGSKKFPLKDPFSTLNKSCITTFSNAFTFPDKTVYPFSTTNNTEYFKIMEIYLDSVFAPNVLEDEKIFMQEGWRYELKEKEDELKYTGVVYGEMMGATSSPMDAIDSNSLKYLYPDTFYRHESGGKPEAIPELDFKKFIDFYKKYYHPSNSYIYLYGDGNLDKELEFIDREYLSKYDLSKFEIENGYQKSFDKIVEKEVNYPLSAEEISDNKYYFSYSAVVGNSYDYKKILSLEILFKILVGNNSSPLKKALIEAKIGDDINVKFEEDIMQTFYQINILNADVKKKELFDRTINETLEKLVKTGINKDLVEAAINATEFDLRENCDSGSRIPKSINYYIDMTKSWYYDKDPFSYLRYERELEEIKFLSDKRYFENLIQEVLINNKHKLFLVLKPDSSIDFENEVKDKLLSIKNNLSDLELEKIISKNKQIDSWQETSDDISKTNTIKILKKEEINSLPKSYPIIKKYVLGIPVYVYEEKNYGVTYLNLFFDAKIISQDKISYLGLFSRLLGDVRTKNYDYLDFSNLINKYTGGMGFSVLALKNHSIKLKYEFVSKFFVSIKFLDSNLEKGIEVLNEFFLGIVFDDKKVLEHLLKIKAKNEINFVERGHLFSIGRLSSYYNELGKYKELIGGYDFFLFVKDLIENFENKKEEIMLNLNEIYQVIFSKQNLIVNLNSKLSPDFIEKINLKDLNNEPIEYEFKLKALNEGFKTNSKVNYVAKGYDFTKLNFNYHGSFLTLKNLLRYDYLWNEVRVKKGAYGSGSFNNRAGDFIFWSYRDPNIKSSLKIYDKTGEYLRNLSDDSEEIFKYVIGSVADLDLPLEINDIGLSETIRIITGIKYDDLAKERFELLNTTKDDLVKLSYVLDEISNQNNICVIGNSNMIEKEKKLFNKVLEL